MKHDLFSGDGQEKQSPKMKDADADHSEDSDLLDMIGRNSAEGDQPKPPQPAKRQAASDGPFLLESLYFHSFGERPLLNREEETELAKRIDRGSNTIRTTLRQTERLLARRKRSDAVIETQQQLRTVRRLSGLSATLLPQQLRPRPQWLLRW